LYISPPAHEFGAGVMIGGIPMFTYSSACLWVKHGIH